MPCIIAEQEICQGRESDLSEHQPAAGGGYHYFVRPYPVVQHRKCLTGFYYQALPVRGGLIHQQIQAPITGQAVKQLIGVDLELHHIGQRAGHRAPLHHL